MIDLRSRKPPQRLEEILAISDPGKFLSALVDLAIPPGTNFHPPPERRHEIRQMISTLSGLSAYAGCEGIWKWLIESDAAYWFAKAQVWLERIGAAKAKEYLDGAAAAFPNGQLPKDDKERGDLLMNSSDLNARLDELDRTYRSSFDEMAECLRAYIKQHFELFRRELEDEENRVVESALPRRGGASRMLVSLVWGLLLLALRCVDFLRQFFSRRK